MSGITMRRWAAAVAASLLVTSAAACASSTTNQPASSGPSASPSTTPTPLATPTPTPPATSTPTPPPHTSTPPVTPSPALRGLPLYPFASLQEARAWEQAYESGGHQPWHTDAEATASSFTAYIGFSGLTVITSRDVRAHDAYIGVGALNPNRQPFTAAVLHLEKYGTDRDAPWEVVGTQDTTLTLTTPGYGSRVSSPVTLGGRITGVDESLSAYVLQSSGASLLGAVHGIPAGGQNAPWKATVVFRSATSHVLTLVVATGGHIAPVERFAITGVTSG